jgi:hypothetical protein
LGIIRENGIVRLKCKNGSGMLWVETHMGTPNDGSGFNFQEYSQHRFTPTMDELTHNV